eukprot:gb/GECG01013134.1/.p1 GENE.gb/GECG01013134.1/~~gb/GECG01013134.1/.p1  ORF type:complete len:131 (+),score=2.48 gb/GECG01013134.1/:1-393(+)
MPRQFNGNDCGIFTACLIRNFATGCTRPFCQRRMPWERQQLAVQLLKYSDMQMSESYEDKRKSLNLRDPERVILAFDNRLSNEDYVRLLRVLDPLNGPPGWNGRDWVAYIHCPEILGIVTRHQICTLRDG